MRLPDGEEWNVPPTIEDATVLDEYAELLPTLGFGKPRTVAPEFV
jgi:hypothetical protein